MLASAYERTGRHEKAKEIYERGITVATAHGHPSMADEYRGAIAELPGAN
jgi:hypothetical protein